MAIFCRTHGWAPQALRDPKAKKTGKQPATPKPTRRAVRAG